MELSEQFTDESLHSFLAYALMEREAEYIRRNFHFHIGAGTPKLDTGNVVVVYCYPSSTADKFRVAFIYQYNKAEIAVWEKKLDLTEKSLLLSLTAEEVLTKLSGQAKAEHQHLLDSELRKYYIDLFLESDR